MGLNMLGNFSSGLAFNGVGNTQINGLNQGVAAGNGNTSLHGQGMHMNSLHLGSPVMHRSSSLGAESLGFTGTGSMVLPGSPLSFSSSNVSGTNSLVSQSLSRQGSANRLDQQEPQQAQQQQVVATSQYSQDSQLFQQQLQADQGQDHAQQIGLPHARSHRAFRLGSQQQLLGMDGLASVKLEQQQINQALTSVKVEQPVDLPLRQPLAPVKLEPNDSALRQQLRIQAFTGMLPLKLDSRQHEQHMHQQLQIPKVEVKADIELPHQILPQSVLTSHFQRQHPQLPMSFLQQRLLQQRSQIQQHQHFQQHLQQMAGPSKQLAFEPGICARRLMQYMYNQRQRPQDNSIHFWRRFVAEFFAPRARKRWCVSQYGNSGRQPTGVFPQDVWHCEICGSRPGRGFETTVEVLPRLCKIKYDSGILDELLYVDISNEYRLNSGVMVLEYGKAIQESIFDQLRVVRDGHLKIVFSPDLKILSWEFCARAHEELLPRRLLIPQVTQLAAIAQKYQNSVNQNQNGVSSLSTQDLQTNCHLFVGAARQLARTLEAPTVNDLGYTKRYVRCLQISEVVNSMKDLIDFSRENGMGPIDSLNNFPRQTASFGGPSAQGLQQRGHLGLPALSSAQSVCQASKAIGGITDNNSLNGSVNNLPRHANTMGSFPAIQQSALTSLPNTMLNNGTSLFAADIDTSSSGAHVPSSLMSPQGTSVNSLQNCHPMMTGQPSPRSVHSHQAQQTSLSSAVSLLQQSVTQGREPETSSAVQHLIQELMLPRSGASYQETYGGGGNAVGSMGMIGGAGILMKNANGSGASASEAGILCNSSSPVHGNALPTNNEGASIERISSSFSNGMVVNQHSSSDNGSNVRSFGSNLSVNNMEVVNAVGTQNLSTLSQEQNLSIGDPSQGLLNDLAGNDDLLSGLENASFNSLPFSW